MCGRFGLSPQPAERPAGAVGLPSHLALGTRRDVGGPLLLSSGPSLCLRCRSLAALLCLLCLFGLAPLRPQDVRTQLLVLCLLPQARLDLSELAGLLAVGSGPLGSRLARGCGCAALGGL